MDPPSLPFNPPTQRNQNLILVKLNLITSKKNLIVSDQQNDTPFGITNQLLNCKTQSQKPFNSKFRFEKFQTHKESEVVSAPVGPDGQTDGPTCPYKKVSFTCGGPHSQTIMLHKKKPHVYNWSLKSVDKLINFLEIFL